MAKTVIGITVDIDDILQEVSRLMSSEQYMLDKANETLKRATGAVTKAKNEGSDLRFALIQLENARTALHKVDTRLDDCLNILLAYHEMGDSQVQEPVAQAPDLGELQRHLADVEAQSG